MKLFAFRFIYKGTICVECYDAYSEEYAIKRLQWDYGDIKFEVL